MSRGRTLRLLFLGLTTVVVFGTYTAIAWTLRRGFNWSDEAFIYDMIASNRRAIGEPWGFQHLLHPLYLLTGQSVLAFRVLRLGGYVLLSLALVWSARFVVSRMGIRIARSGWVFILLLAQVGTFLAWSYPPPDIGYNELSSWFTQLGVALILLSLAWGLSPPHSGAATAPRGTGAAWPLWAIWAGLGAVTMLLLFAKVSSGVALGAFLVLAVVIPHPTLRFWKRAAAVGAGAGAVLSVLWVLKCPISFYFENMSDVLFDTSTRDTLGRPISGMVVNYLRSLRSTGFALLPVLLIFTLLAATFGRRVRSSRDSAGGKTLDWLTWVLGALLVIAVVALPRKDVWSYLGELTGFIGGAGIIGLATLGGASALRRRSAISQRLAVTVGGSAVAATPFISSVGTSNRITGQLVFAATLWAVVLGIVLVLLTQRGAQLHSFARSVPVLIGFVVIVTSALAVRADIAKPYQTATVRPEDTSTSVPELRGLLLPATEAAWIDWVASAGRSLGAGGVPATAIYASGALYAFNHSGYANPWVGSKWPAAFRSLTLACEKARPADLFVLQPGNESMHGRATTGVTRSLAACRIHFPGDFRVVEKRDSADPRHAMTIWQLKSR